MMRLDLSKHSDNLRNRMLYGFVGFFLMLGGMLGNAWTYFFVFGVICFACLLEFYRLLIAAGKQPLMFWGMTSGMVLYVFAFLINQGTLEEKYYFLVYPFFSLVFILKLYAPHDTQPFENVGLTLLGMVYVAIPFAALHWAVFLLGHYSYQIILGLFLLVWINDIAAYFWGSRYGVHKLMPHISPGKSWQGSAGGAVLTPIIAALNSLYFTDLAWWQWGGISILVVVVSTYGDLVESMFKRSLQVKDSSEAIPGHGGFLDRFDGLLLCAPVVAVFLKIFQ